MSSAARLASPTLLAIVAFAGCAVGGFDNPAGVRVEGAGNAIQLAWDADHPWAARFASGGSAFHLYAQYRNGGKPVEQDLGAARPSQGRLSFDLPTSLRAVPDSQVCLFIGLNRTTSAVPVRTVVQPGMNTAQFRYAAWENQVIVGSVAAIAQREANALNSNIGEMESDLAQMRANLEKAGVRRPEDCAPKGVVPSTAAAAPPSDVLAPGQQQDGAERVCVNRARVLERIGSLPVSINDLSLRAMNESSGGANDRMKALATLFVNGWKKWSARTATNYQPEIGSPRDILPLGGAFVEILKQWRDVPAARTPDVTNAVTLGLLDGYSGCLEDVGKQLKVKYEAWQRAAANKPARDRLYAERQQEICLGNLNNAKQLADQIAQAKAKVKEGGGAASGGDIPLSSSGRVLLNNESCSM